MIVCLSFEFWITTGSTASNENFSAASAARSSFGSTRDLTDLGEQLFRRGAVELLQPVVLQPVGLRERRAVGIAGAARLVVDPNLLSSPGGHNALFYHARSLRAPPMIQPADG